MVGYLVTRISVFLPACCFLIADEMSEEEEVTHKTRRGSMAEPPSDHEGAVHV